MSDLTLNEIRELIIEFYTKNDPAKLRGGLDVAGMADWTLQMGLDALNDVLFFQYGKKISLNTDLGTSKDQLNRISAVFGLKEDDEDEDLKIEEKERKELEQKLKKFYEKHTEVEMSSEDVGRLVSFAMFHGVESLNEKLVGKYGEGIMDEKEAPKFQSVKGKTMARPEKIDEEKLRVQLRIFFEIHDPAWVDNLDNVVEQAHELGMKGLNARLIELYGESLDSVAEIAKRKKMSEQEKNQGGREGSTAMNSNPLAEFSTKGKKGGKKKKKKYTQTENVPLVNSLNNRLKQKFDESDEIHHQNKVESSTEEEEEEEKRDKRFDNYDSSLTKRGPMGLPGFGPPPTGMFKSSGAAEKEEDQEEDEEEDTQEKKMGGGGGPRGSQFTEVTLSLPPPPFEDLMENDEKAATKKFEVDEAKLKKNLIKFYDEHDKEEIQNVDDVIELAKEIGEDALDLKLNQYYGESLSAFMENQANKTPPETPPRTPKAAPKTPPKTPPKSPPRSLVSPLAEEETLSEPELKKQIILFYEKHDPERIETIDEIITLSKQIGQKALNAYLKDFYGEDLADVQREREEAERLAQEAVTVKKEKPKEPPRKPEKRELKDELMIYYEKHDPLKLEAIGTIVDLGNKIGRVKLNDKLQQIYGQSLDETLAEHDGVPVEFLSQTAPPTQPRKKKKKKPRPGNESAKGVSRRVKKPPPGAVPLHPVKPVRTNPNKARSRRKKTVSARTKLMSVKGGQIPKVPLKQFKQRDHGEQARSLLGGDNNASKVESGACNNYRLDMTGASFGVCKCGYPRADHVRSTKKKPEWAR